MLDLENHRHTPAAAAVFAAQPGTCRYPVAHDAEFRFCGEPVAMRLDKTPSSYCATCRQITIAGTLKFQAKDEVRS